MTFLPQPIQPGSYRFSTVTGSAYDLLVAGQASTLTRVPGVLPVHPSADGLDSVDLRRDAEPIAILEITELEVGRPGIFILDLRRDGRPTVRTTSNILSIEPQTFWRPA